MRRYVTVAAICLVAAVFLAAPAYAQCPGGMTPLQALNGTWGFKLQGFSVVGPGTGFVGAVGRFTASIGTNPRAPGFLQGLLTGTMAAANFNGTAAPLHAAVTGNYQVENDCSGGNLSFGNGILPPGFRTLQFVFVNGGAEMYLMTVDNNGVILVGEAKRI